MVSETCRLGTKPARQIIAVIAVQASCSCAALLLSNVSFDANTRVVASHAASTWTVLWSGNVVQLLLISNTVQCA